MKRLVSESAVYGLSSVMSKMMNIILLPLYATMFTVSDYGVLAILTVFTSLLSQLVMLQLDSGAFRFILDKDNQQEIQRTLSSWFWTQFSISIFVSIACFFYSSSISQILFSSSKHSLLITISILALPFSTVENICSTYWRIRGMKWHVAITNIISVLILLGLNYYFVKVLKLGIISLAWSTLLVALIKNLLLVPIIYPLVPIYQYRFSRLKEMLHYCLPFVPAGISLWVVTLIDRIILEKYANTSEVGLYQMAYNIASLLLLPINAFLQAWPPYVFSILNDITHKKIIAKSVLIFIIFTSIAALSTTLFSSEILTLLASPSYYVANTFVPILLFSNISMGLYQLSGIGSAIAKKTHFVMWATIIAAVINILLNFILIPRYKIFGASWATFISYAIIPLYLFYFSQKVYPIPYNFKWIIVSFFGLFAICIIFNTAFTNFELNGYFLSIKIAFIILISGISFFYFRNKMSNIFSME